MHVLSPLRKFLFLIVFATLTPATGQDLSYYSLPAGDSHPAAHAVKVKRGGLVHTRLLTALESPKGDYDRVVADLIGQLAGIARAYDTDLSAVAKLNLYLGKVDQAKMMSVINKKIHSTWPVDRQPAVTIIPSRLIGDGQLAGDAVISSAKKGGPIDRFERDAAMMPSDRDIIYISGRAAKGELAAATAGTMKELFAVLKDLGSKKENVIQVKAFIRPMDQWKVVEREIEASFAGGPIPPVVYVEWTSSSRPTEIELIAAAEGKAETKQGVSYFTPEGEKPSPVYSKVAQIHADEVVYIGGIVGSVAEPSVDQVKSLYSALKLIAEKSGSSLHHLVKATYYVSDSEDSAALNQLRPEYYDAKRPPAASKVAIPKLLEKDKGLLIDMVAVPKQ